MKILEYADLFEGELATYWFEEDGVLCAIAKDTERTLENEKANYAFVKQITGDRKVCVLSDATHARTPDKEIRDYMEAELPKHFKAVAMLSKSMIGEVLSKLFLEINRPALPIKYFDSLIEAKEWLKQYL